MSPGEEHDLHDIPPPRKRPEVFAYIHKSGATPTEAAKTQVRIAGAINEYLEATGQSERYNATPDDIEVDTAE